MEEFDTSFSVDIPYIKNDIPGYNLSLFVESMLKVITYYFNAYDENLDKAINFF